MLILHLELVDEGCHLLLLGLRDPQRLLARLRTRVLDILKIYILVKLFMRPFARQRFVSLRGELRGNIEFNRVPLMIL